MYVSYYTPPKTRARLSLRAKGRRQSEIASLLQYSSMKIVCSTAYMRVHAYLCARFACPTLPIIRSVHMYASCFECLQAAKNVLERSQKVPQKRRHVSFLPRIILVGCLPMHCGWCAWCREPKTRWCPNLPLSLQRASSMAKSLPRWRGWWGFARHLVLFCARVWLGAT